MKRWISLITILALTLTMLFAIAEPVKAEESPEVLVNPSFENDLEGWQKHIRATLTVDIGEYQQGDYSCHATDKYNNNDGPFQDVTEKVGAYGKGQYRISAYMKLDTVESLEAYIVIGIVESDKSKGSGGKRWFSGNKVMVNNKTWTKLDGLVDLQWDSELIFCEFYYVIGEKEPDKGKEPHYLDNCSMVKLDFDASKISASPKPMPTPVPSATVVKAAATEMPAVTDAPTEAVTATPTAVPPAPKGGIKPLSFILFGGAALLIAAGTGLLILDHKRRKAAPPDRDKYDAT